MSQRADPTTASARTVLPDGILDEASPLSAAIAPRTVLTTRPGRLCAQAGHASRRFRGSAVRVGAVTIVLWAGAMLNASIASGDYHVEVCSDLATGAPSNSSGWTVSQSGSYDGASGCNGGGYMWAALFAGVSHNYTDNATLTFTAPVNTTIASFSLWRWDQAAPSQPYGSPINTINVAGQNIDACSQADGCSEEGSTTSPTASLISATGLSAAQITLIAACGGGPGGVCPSSSEQDEIRVYGGDIELSQSTAPVAGTVAGSLIAAGTHSGTQTVSFSASDDGSGVYSASLIIDGQNVESEIVDPDGGHCVPTRENPDGTLVFNYAVPCPATAAGYFSYNTAQLANGPHDVRIVIADAAGNTTTAFDGTITVQNLAGAAEPGSVTTPWQITLRVTPREVHQGTLITLSGAVSTTPRPPAGKLVYLQARDVTRGWRGRERRRHLVNVYGPWITFRVLQTQPSGSFTATYRFRLGGDHHYQMRAVAPPEGGFPEPAGRSAPELITET